MSVAKPAASRLFCRSLAANSIQTSSRAVATGSVSTTSCQPQRHEFHTSTALAGRKRSPFRNVKAEKMGLLNPNKPEVMREFKNTISPDYDDTDTETLEKLYTPEQLEALRLGEKAIPAEDMVIQGRMRNDPYRFRYVEDFSTIRPVIDKRVKSGRPVDTSARFMTPDEFGDDFLEHIRETSVNRQMDKPFGVGIDDALTMYEDMRSKMLGKDQGASLSGEELAESMDKVLGSTEAGNLQDDIQRAQEELATKEDKEPKRTGKKDESGSDEWVEVDGPHDLDFYRYLIERNSMTGFDGGDTALAPDLPDKVPGVAGLYKQQMGKEEAELDPEGTYQDLKKQTGLSIERIVEIFNRHTKILVKRYVSNQTRLGKIRSTYILAVAGNYNGRLGVGEAKSVDHTVAVQKAKLAAIRNMLPIRRYEHRTIYGNVEAKVGGTIVQLYTRPPGFGLRVSHRIFEIARLAGITDLAAKMPRSRNPMNSVKACVQALTNQPNPENIALGRGRKLVDARKVYYGGAVH